jgi:hypothetical protein
MCSEPDHDPGEVAECETARLERPARDEGGPDVPRIAPLPSWTGTALVLWPVATLLTAAAVGAAADAGLALAAASLMNFAMILVATLWISMDLSPRSIIAAAIGAAAVATLLGVVLAGSAWIGRKATTVEVSAAMSSIATPASGSTGADGDLRFW